MNDENIEEIKEVDVDSTIDTTGSDPPPLLEPEAKKQNIVVRIVKGIFRIFGKLILVAVTAFFIFLPIWVVLPVETKAEISAKVEAKTGYVIPTYDPYADEEEIEEANEEAAYYAELDSYVEPVIDQIITSDMTDYDKAKAVYDWICANIAYDYAGLETGTGNGDPLEVMQTGLADCGGYSGLFDYFMMKLGISCEVVNGDAPDGGYHAWNKVNINGKWLNVDATWGDSPNSEDYFGKTDAEFADLGYTAEATNDPF